MTHFLARLASVITAAVLGCWTFLNWFAGLIGLATLPEDASAAQKLVYRTWSAALSSPPWMPLVCFAAAIALSAYLYRITYARDVIIQSDNVLADLRSSSDVVLNFSKANNVLIRPIADFTVHPPVDPREGVFRLYVLMGDNGYKMAFSSEFEFVGGQQIGHERQPAQLNEFQVIVVKDGRRHRYFILDNLAYLKALSELAAKVGGDIDAAKREAFDHAFFLSS